MIYSPPSRGHRTLSQVAAVRAGSCLNSGWRRRPGRPRWSWILQIGDGTPPPLSASALDSPRLPAVGIPGRRNGPPLSTRSDDDDDDDDRDGIGPLKSCFNNPQISLFYLLNTQLQDIIKHIYTQKWEKDIKTLWKKAYTHKNTIKSKA